MPPLKLLIVGGVAGGASCAARARRLSETASIILFDKGPFVSFANCGLPYHVGNIIPAESSLLLASPQLFLARFNVDVRLHTEVTAIDLANKTVSVTSTPPGAPTPSTYTESYDKLVLAPGAAALRPPIPGIASSPAIFVLKTIPDSRAIRAWLDAGKNSAVVVGGGFIGLETAENLVHRGLSVTLIEGADHVMAPYDPEFAILIEAKLRENGVNLVLAAKVAGFEPLDGGNRVRVAVHTGASFDADLAVLGLGVKPETAFAAASGLEMGARGAIKVDEGMRTSDPDVFAVGDVVESEDVVTGARMVLALAGPANRQGRIAAENAMGGKARFRGVQGTSVLGLFGMTAACTGASEKTLKGMGMEYGKVYLHPKSHAGYYPGAEQITMKLLYHPTSGKVLGAQAVGLDGVDKRIDVVAMAIQANFTVHDLSESELCYAPQFGSAKDPVNFAGFIAANSISGLSPLAHWDTLPEDAKLVDVRNPGEVEKGAVPGMVNIPLPELRKRLGELDKSKPVYAYCQVGQRGHYATRVLKENGFDAFNVSGGYLTYCQFHPEVKK